MRAARARNASDEPAVFTTIELASDLAYYIVYRPSSARLPKLVAFRDWLVAEAARR